MRALIGGIAAGCPASKSLPHISPAVAGDIPIYFHMADRVETATTRAVPPAPTG